MEDLSNNFLPDDLVLSLRQPDVFRELSNYVQLAALARLAPPTWTTFIFYFFHFSLWESLSVSSLMEDEDLHQMEVEEDLHQEEEDEDLHQGKEEEGLHQEEEEGDLGHHHQEVLPVQAAVVVAVVLVTM